MVDDRVDDSIRTDNSKLYYTTAGLRPFQKSNYWNNVICENFIHLDCDDKASDSFFAEIKARKVNQLCITHMRSGPMGYARTASGIQKGKEKVLVVNFQLDGNSFIHQDGREVELKAGDFACYDATRPYYVSAGKSNEVVTINAPSDIFVSLFGLTERVTAKAVRGDTHMGELAAGFLRKLAPTIEALNQSTAERLFRISLDLSITALSEMLAEEPASPKVGRMLLLYRAKCLIQERLSDPDLNLNKVAQLLGISKRYLSDLFRDEDTSVQKWVWDRRLDNACQALSNPLLTGQSISRIAYNCGFSDMSHFCHRFKEVHSITPTAFRKRHLNASLQ